MNFSKSSNDQNVQYDSKDQYDSDDQNVQYDSDDSDDSPKVIDAFFSQDRD